MIDPTMTDLDRDLARRELGELVELFDTALAAIHDLDRAIARATENRDRSPGVAALDLRIARGEVAYSARYLGDALERVESVGRSESRDRHPSSGATR